MIRFVFVLLLFGFLWSFLAASHPIRVSARKDTGSKPASEDHPTKVIFTPYGYRSVREVAPNPVSSHTNALQRIHPVIWTAMFTFAAVGLSYWLSDYEKRRKKIRTVNTGSQDG